MREESIAAPFVVNTKKGEFFNSPSSDLPVAYFTVMLMVRV
jgi:hypothetical protein